MSDVSSVKSPPSYASIPIGTTQQEFLSITRLLSWLDGQLYSAFDSPVGFGCSIGPLAARLDWRWFDGQVTCTRRGNQCTHSHTHTHTHRRAMALRGSSKREPAVMTSTFHMVPFPDRGPMGRDLAIRPSRDAPATNQLWPSLPAVGQV